MTGSPVRTLFIVSALLYSSINFGAEAVHDELKFQFVKTEDTAAELDAAAESITQDLGNLDESRTRMMTIPTTNPADLARNNVLYRLVSAEEMGARCPFGCYHHLGPDDGRSLTKEEVDVLLQGSGTHGEESMLAQGGEAALQQSGSLAEEAGNVSKVKIEPGFYNVQEITFYKDKACTSTLFKLHGAAGIQIEVLESYGDVALVKYVTTGQTGYGFFGGGGGQQAAATGKPQFDNQKFGNLQVQQQGLDFQSCTNFKELGNGAFGLVHSAVCNFNGKAVKVAIKTPISGENAQQGAMLLGAEIVLMDTLRAQTAQNPRFEEVTVQMLGGDLTPSHMKMALEFATHGDLAHNVETLAQQPGCAWKLLSDICTAFLGAPNLVHRDMKPENFLIFANQDGSVQFKLADFGLASIDGKSMVAGTPGYAPLETALGLDGGHPGDVFAAGVTVLELIMGAGRAIDIGCGIYQSRTHAFNCGVTEGVSYIKDVAAQTLATRWHPAGPGTEADKMSRILQGMLRDAANSRGIPRSTFAQVSAEIQMAAQSTACSIR